MDKTFLKAKTMFFNLKSLKLFCLLLLAGWAPLFGQNIVINEIHYKQEDKTLPLEFIEIYNAGATAVDLSGWFFSKGVEFTFPQGSAIGSGNYLVIAEDPQALSDHMPSAGPVLGPWFGRLDNDGELIILRNSEGNVMDQVDYRAEFPWPLDSVGQGSSMELINPGLDNDLAGSWRSSGMVASGNPTRQYFLAPQSDGWLYRKGTSEPPADWRESGFTTDGTWLPGTTSIGFGDGDDNTPITDMQNNYTSIYLRRTVTIEDAEALEGPIHLGVYADDGAVVWINNQEVRRVSVPDGDLAHDAVGNNHEATWEEASLVNPSALLQVGENIIAVHALNTRLGSSDFSIDASLFIPADGEGAQATPTPGAKNSVFADNAAPHIRQVQHQPQQPAENEAFTVSARITDPDNVAAVQVLYQVVLPGQFIPAFLPLPHATLLSNANTPFEPNPDFENPSNWTAVDMVDDGAGGDAVAGDGIYTATLPGQINRTLVRYRIVAEDALGAAVRVPYLDDPSLNFACFVYNGVPAYTASYRSVHPDGAGHVYSEAVMNSLPVYIILTREVDFTQCIAYSSSYQISKGNEPARDKFNWEGAFVYNGEVYDHFHYRLRQANDRYGGSGKRSFRFRFNRGRYMQAYDNYGRKFPEKWRTLNTGKMFDNKRVGNFGLTETLNHELWNTVGVPAPWVYTFQMRVVKGADEVPAGNYGQYYGDFYGMHIIFEDYDPRFMDTHGLEDGNLYKLKDGQFNGNDLKRNQGRFAVTDDSDFQNIRNNCRPERTNAWLDAHVNFYRWNRYHAVVEGIRHYDFRPADSHSKNRGYYFEPDYSGSSFGRLWLMPWDSDASWGPSWNSGIDYPKNAIFSGAGKEPFKMNYRNFMREFRDLIWTEEVINQMIDDLAEMRVDMAMADRDRWRSAPSAAGTQDFGPMETKVRDMKNFAFVGWSGSTGPTVGAGGRAAYLDYLARGDGENTKIPRTPTVTSTAPEGFPVDALTFTASVFSDPQGDGFGAMKWRIGAVSPPDAPFDATRPRVYEWPAVWEKEQSIYDPAVTIPQTAVTAGTIYRVRVRMMDDTGRWSHWSAPVEFTAGEPLVTPPQKNALRITEIMYDPEGGQGYEFIEIQNIGSETVDLTDVRFTDGVEFSFQDSPVTSLEAGQYVVLVNDLVVFSLRYNPDDILVAGEYVGNLENMGESVALMYGVGVDIQRFTYDPGWYPVAPGGGYALVADNPYAPVDYWSQKALWRRGTHPYGTPGRPELEEGWGFMRPGDMNQDARLDLSDAVSYLIYLFDAGDHDLPCGDGAVDHAGNKTLFDLNDDDDVDLADAIYLLSYLFNNGDAPVAGEWCIPVFECPNYCGG